MHSTNNGVSSAMPRLSIVIQKDNLLARPLDWTLQKEQSLAAIEEFAGLLFVIGSIYFLPSHAEEHPVIGPAFFIVGASLSSLISTFDLYELLATASQQLDWLSVTTTTLYLVGAVVYVIGSILFLPVVNQVTAGAIAFVLGSMAYIVAAVVNRWAVEEQDDRWQGRAALHLTLDGYLLGATFFLGACLPYLAVDECTNPDLHWYLSGQFIAGSLLFVVGGLANYARVHQKGLGQER